MAQALLLACFVLCSYILYTDECATKQGASPHLAQFDFDTTTCPASQSDPPLPARILYQSPKQYPEGVEWDAHRSRFLVGSAVLGNILAVYDNGTTKVLVADPDYAGSATLGLNVDKVKNRVVVAIHSFNPAAPYDAVAAYDLTSGKRQFLRRLDTIPVESTPRAGPPIINDCSVDRGTGNTYCTDSSRSLIWNISRGGNYASVFTADPIFENFTTAPLIPIGLNGITVQPEQYILTCNTGRAALFKVPLPSGQNPTQVQMTSPPIGCDGLRLRADGKLVVTGVVAAYLIETTDEWATAAIIDTLPQDPSKGGTTFALRGSHAYINFAYFNDGAFTGGSRADFEIARLDFPSDV